MYFRNIKKKLKHIKKICIINNFWELMRLYSTIEPWGPDSIPWMEKYKEKTEATWHLTATFLEYTYTNTHVIKLKSCKKIAKQPNQNIQGFAKR